MKGTTMHMLIRLLLACLATGWGSLATAQHTVQVVDRCTLAWNANTEEDLAGYRLYHSGTQIDVGPRTSATCAEVGIRGPGRYSVSLSAYDTSQNESALSAPLTIQMAVTPPTYVQSGTDAQGVLWGLVDEGLTPMPKYHVYRNGVAMPDLYDIASDLRIVHGVAYFGGTDGDTQWWVYAEDTGWQVATLPEEPPPPPPPPVPVPTPAHEGLTIRERTEQRFVVSGTPEQCPGGITQSSTTWAADGTQVADDAPTWARKDYTITCRLQDR